MTITEPAPARVCLLKEKIDAEGRSTKFDYNRIGQLKKKTLARARLSVTYSYFDMSATGPMKGSGLLQKVDYLGSTPDVTYTYTRLGQIQTVVDGASLDPSYGFRKNGWGQAL